jgi:hypothetical protein
MASSSVRITSVLKHAHDRDKQGDEHLQKEASAYVKGHAGIRFVADVLAALNAAPIPVRSARDFFNWFSPREVLEALSERPDLRVKLVRAVTGGPPALLRRMAAADLAAQIDLLAVEDLPASERDVRAEGDRTLTLAEIYLKYLEPQDVVAYLPLQRVWSYEGHDSWWTRTPSPATRALLTAQLKAVRRHAILSDSEILDAVGEEALERDFPLAIRTKLRTAARKAARENKPFRDTDIFAALVSEGRDGADELVEYTSAVTLHKIVQRAAEAVGFASAEPPAAVLEVKELPVAVAMTAAAVAATVAPVSATPAPVSVTPAPVAVTPAPAALGRAPLGGLKNSPAPARATMAGSLETGPSNHGKGRAHAARAAEPPAPPPAVITPANIGNAKSSPFLDYGSEPPPSGDDVVFDEGPPTRA